jgi:hypothetical protein
MRTICILSILVLALSLALQAAKPKQQNLLIGGWRLVKAKNNGKPNPETVMDRTMFFSDDNTFEGKVFMNGEEKPYNSGIFLLATDSTLITIHSTPNGKLSQLAYTYNFHVRNDSLHLYGVYFSKVMSEPRMLQMNYIDEWWVKPQVLNKN